MEPELPRFGFAQPPQDAGQEDAAAQTSSTASPAFLARLSVICAKFLIRYYEERQQSLQEEVGIRQQRLHDQELSLSSSREQAEAVRDEISILWQRSEALKSEFASQAELQSFQSQVLQCEEQVLGVRFLEASDDEQLAGLREQYWSISRQLSHYDGIVERLRASLSPRRRELAEMMIAHGRIE